jgi:hypothetical protein
MREYQQINPEKVDDKSYPRFIGIRTSVSLTSSVFLRFGFGSESSAEGFLVLKLLRKFCLPSSFDLESFVLLRRLKRKPLVSV